MDVHEAIETRRAYRSFERATSTEETARDLARHASLAPSCFNKQPWRFLFLESPEALAKGHECMVEQNRVWASRAPLVVIGYSRRQDDCLMKDGRAYHQFDLGMSVMDIMLAATHHGLVARPMAGFKPDTISELFGLADDEEPLVVVAIGRPSDDESHLPDRYKGLTKQPRERKPASEIVQRL